MIALKLPFVANKSKGVNCPLRPVISTKGVMDSSLSRTPVPLNSAKMGTMCVTFERVFVFVRSAVFKSFCIKGPIVIGSDNK